jgi:hypothetical protein
VLVRPHPQAIDFWQAWTPAPELGPVAAWPRIRQLPVTEAAKADFYDTLYHASAVVGLNTSALWEAAILGHPTLTVTDGRFREGQAEAEHFGYLCEGRDDDLLVASPSMAAHVHALEAALDDRAGHTGRAQAFVERYIRPAGPAVRASSLAADALTTIVERGPETDGRSGRSLSQAQLGRINRRLLGIRDAAAKAQPGTVGQASTPTGLASQNGDLGPDGTAEASIEELDRARRAKLLRKRFLAEVVDRGQFSADWFSKNVVRWEGSIEQLEDRPVEILENGSF